MHRHVATLSRLTVYLNKTGKPMACVRCGKIIRENDVYYKSARRIYDKECGELLVNSVPDKKPTFTVETVSH
jgi:hypothetical protein